MSIVDLIADPAAGPDAERADEALAYVLLEEARLVCERLRDSDVVSEPEESLLMEVHADVGMGAYEASDRMDPPLRSALLGLVRERDVASVMDDGEASEHLLRLCLHATEVLDRAADRPRNGPDLRGARVRAHDAVAAVSVLLGPRRAREVRREATRLPV
jgi:hypothetical protein